MKCRRGVRSWSCRKEELDCLLRRGRTGFGKSRRYRELELLEGSSCLLRRGGNDFGLLKNFEELVMTLQGEDVAEYEKFKPVKYIGV